MQCPQCGSKTTRVLRTDALKGGSLVRRRHECGNGCRFNSFQVHDYLVRRIGRASFEQHLDIVRRGVEKRSIASLRKRKAMRLLAGGMSTHDVAAELSITEARVRQIRAEATP